jgi:predicted alpha-1,2-mannosidase
MHARAANTLRRMGWAPKSFSALAAVVATVVGGVLLTGVAPAARAEALAFVTDPVEHVDTLIGTGTGGDTMGEINNFPGAAVPFGMVQYSPDTTDTYAGYDHDNARSTGFSLNHASVGCAAFGDIPMLPTTTPIGRQPWYAWETIAHDDTEAGMPGYYTVRFPDTGVSAELTATSRTGVGRFRYPANDRPALFHVRPGGSLAGNFAASIRINEDNTTVTGSATTGGFCGAKNTYTVYFAMKLSQPFISHGTWDSSGVHPGARSAQSPWAGGWVEFPAGSELEVHTAISYVSLEGARANLAADIVDGFDQVRAAASSEWNAALSRIRVAGTNNDDIKTFYTALYRSLLHPNTFNDTDGRYIGFDGAIHEVAKGHVQYANFSDWDTYRCLAALQAMLFPERASDMAQSLVNDARQSGSLPRWALANSSTGIMTGDNPVPLIVGLYTFGAKDFDIKAALYYMLKAATDGGVGLGDYVERRGIASYLQHGYAPQTPEFGAGHATAGASITLEWSVDDFTISRFADALGEPVVASEFRRRAQFWQNLFNPVTGFVSPRDATGTFLDGPGFASPDTELGQQGFDEGNADQYLWMVPQNIAGLVSDLGGRQAAVSRLDRFTTELNAGANKPYLWVGNEPNFAVPWLYNYIGQPWKTQQTVDRVRSQLFGPTPQGEPGNDDLGAESSWYVWAALGLYPVTPGTSILTVNTPLFDQAEIALPTGKLIRISAPGASSGLKYINGLSIDGQAADQTFLPESIVRTGADVAFALSIVPNLFWGTAESSAPPSFGASGLGHDR